MKHIKDSHLFKRQAWRCNIKDNILCICGGMFCGHSLEINEDKQILTYKRYAGRKQHYSIEGIKVLIEVCEYCLDVNEELHRLCDKD